MRDPSDHERVAERDGLNLCRAPGSPVRTSFNAVMTSMPVARIAGARPNRMPVSRDSAAATPSTVPVQLRAQREAGPAVREEEREEAHAEDREQHAERSAERREQNALGEKLPHDAKPSGAET